MRLFSRRTSNNPPTATESVASSTSTRESLDGDYVLPVNAVYNIPAASATRLRLPFRRRQHPPSQNLLSLNDPPHISSVTSDPGHGLPPPPPKSAIFGGHNSSLPSVHSLPGGPSTHARSDTLSRPSSSHACSEPHSAPVRPHKKTPGLFFWARERTKSKPPQPSSSLSSVSSSGPSADHAASSFNLMSFRHIRADSPSQQPPLPSSDALLPPARPRPRGDSAASDSSQRISVAAFREAQARSRANSPVPSFRPPSAADTLRVDANGRQRASTVSVTSATDRPLPNKLVPAPVPNIRSDPSPSDSSSEDSDPDDDDEVDSDGEPIPKPATARPDAAPASAPGSIAQPVHVRRRPLPAQSDQAPRQRASASASASTPSGAARIASILATTNPPSSSHAQSGYPVRKPTDDTDDSSDSEDTDSEDVPLSGLTAPRRPASSASNYSNSRSRLPQKPLIDINTLAAGGPPLLTPILRHENSIKNLHIKGKEPDVEKDQPFSIPTVLAFSSSTSPPMSPSPTRQNASLVNKPASAAHDRRFSGDVSAISNPKATNNDDDLINAIRLVGALDKESDPSSGPPVKSPSDRIVPTPIRIREPESRTSFTVLSRPPQRQSTAETSPSLSPTSQDQQSSLSHSPHSPQPDTGARQRASTMVNPTAQGDKSDTMSVTSAVRSSAPRNPRIPPVPLIHSVPDSPSVKEDYKPGRPRSASRTSLGNTSQGRSQPPPTTLAPAISSTSSKTLPSGSQPSSMPQRPFASKSSMRGQSPAGSSTGDSSSGRSPFTPRDGSDIGVRPKDDTSDMGSTLKARGHGRKHSVTFEEETIRGRERAKADLTSEQRTRERRRSEAKAALELGKIVNGRGPLVNDDSDEDMGLRGRAPAINVTMENGMIPSWPAWQQPVAAGMTPMVPPLGNDPAYLAAHQRALLIAKQAYQMAVAQHAMQLAGEEWERSSNAGFGSGGSVYGGGSGGSAYGGESGGSIYAGGSRGSVYGGGGAGMAPMGMMGVPNMGMLIPPNLWATRNSVAFPSATASVYGGISSSQSEYGGGGGWGTRSVYGDAFGPSSSHPSYGGNGAPSGSTSVHGSNSRPRARTGVSPPSTSSSQPSRTPGKNPVRGRVAPPSSWKSGR